MPASDGETALELAMNFAFDSIVLDIGLPARDGYSVAQAIRGHCPVSILMLTARDREEDILSGFDHGADDYLTKPFLFRELLARIDALGRSSARRQEPCLRLDSVRLLVDRDRTAIQLTRSEFLLLAALHRHAGSTIDRQTLMEAVWESPRASSANALDVLVNGLRSKIDSPFREKLLVTVRGVGYRLQSSAPSPASRPA